MKFRSKAGIHLAAVVLAVAFSLPTQAQTGNPHAVSLYNLGLTAYKQGSPESAIIFFKRACDIDPDLADAQYNLGVIYQSQKRMKEAAPRFQEVIRIRPNDPDAHYQLGLCLIDLGQAAEAKQHLSSIAPNDKHFADAQKRLALLDQPGGAAQSGVPSTTPAATDQLANPIVTTPSATIQPPVSPLTSSPPVTPTLIAAQNPTATTPGITTAPSTVATQATQVVNPPNVVNPASQTQAIAVAPPRPVPGNGPTAVLANSSVKVIAIGFSAPAGLAFDHSGNLYIANFLSNSIDRISPDGTRSQFSSGSNLKGPIGLIVDSSGNVYVANYVGGNIARINPAGVSTVIATGFRKPYYLTMDKEGNLFVSQQEDNSVVKVSLPRPIGIGAKPE